MGAGYRDELAALQAKIRALEEQLKTPRDEERSRATELRKRRIKKLEAEVANLRAKLQRTPQNANRAKGPSQERAVGGVGALIDRFFSEPGETTRLSWPMRIFGMGFMLIALIPLVLMFVPIHRQRVATVDSTTGQAPLRKGQRCQVDATCRRMIGDSEVHIDCPGVGPIALPATCSFEEESSGPVSIHGTERGAWEVTLDLRRSQGSLRRTQRHHRWSVEITLARIE